MPIINVEARLSLTDNMVRMDPTMHANRIARVLGVCHATASRYLRRCGYRLVWAKPVRENGSIIGYAVWLNGKEPL